MLYCDNDPVDLGIKDAQGVWDMTAFRKHIQSCGPCGRFIELLTLETICGLELHQKTNKGNPKAALIEPGKRLSTTRNQIPTPETEA